MRWLSRFGLVAGSKYTHKKSNEDGAKATGETMFFRSYVAR